MSPESHVGSCGGRWGHAICSNVRCCGNTIPFPKGHRLTPAPRLRETSNASGALGMWLATGARSRAKRAAHGSNRHSKRQPPVVLSRMQGVVGEGAGSAAMPLGEMCQQRIADASCSETSYRPREGREALARLRADEGHHRLETPRESCPPGALVRSREQNLPEFQPWKLDAVLSTLDDCDPGRDVPEGDGGPLAPSIRSQSPRECRHRHIRSDLE